MLRDETGNLFRGWTRRPNRSGGAREGSVSASEALTTRVHGGRSNGRIRTSVTMARRNLTCRVAAALSITLAACGGSSGSLTPPTSNVESVTVRRDAFGVPHVFAESDAGAFYGLGWSVAQDRLFQMHWARLAIRGRTASVMGRGPANEYLKHDRETAIIGYGRAADRMAAELPPTVKALMGAYVRGVNAYVAEVGTGAHPMFAQLGVDFEPWTAADSIGVWLGLARHFTPPARFEAQNYNDFQQAVADAGGDVDAAIAAFATQNPVDESAAVVKESDVDPALRAEIQAYADGLGISPAHAARGFNFGHDAPKFSHAWAVGGGASSTGSTILFNDPQAPILVPGLFHEWHIVGPSFEVRGVSPAGCLNLIVGSTPDVAWGTTSSGADQRDLFLIKLNDDVDPDSYLLDGVFRPFEVEEQVSIEIAGEAPEQVTYRETVWGPVITDLFQPVVVPGRGVALKTVMLNESSSFIGFWDMFHAKTTDELRQATEGWRTPSVNLILGDRNGDVGYLMKGPVPLRSLDAPLGGRVAHEGDLSSMDWIGYIPHDYLPWVIDPASDSVLSGNHLPVGSWYPLPLGLGTGGNGDTSRSRRMRELIEELGTLDPDDMTSIHLDVVHTARRDLAILGEHLRDQGVSLSVSATFALGQLGPWLDLGAPMTEEHPGAALAHFFDTVLRPELSADMAELWGGGENGLQYFLKTRTAELEGGATMPLTAREQEYVIDQLEMAAEGIRTAAGGDPAQWPAWYRDNVLTRQVQPWTNLDGLPSLVAPAPVTLGPLVCADEGTILSQVTQCYTQRVVLGDPDLMRTLMPIGESESNPAHVNDQQTVHATAQLKVLQTDEAKLITAGATTKVLEFDPDV